MQRTIDNFICRERNLLSLDVKKETRWLMRITDKRRERESQLYSDWEKDSTYEKRMLRRVYFVIISVLMRSVGTSTCQDDQK
jgi:hypothetical protein